MNGHPAVEAFRGARDLIRVVGHRGARGVLPENTMPGFAFAIASGAPLLEFDVVMTSDEVPVITHNHHLHAPTFRAPDGRFLSTEPKVSDLTWAELQTYDVGRIDGRTAYGQRFPDQAQIDGLRVPRLKDLLDYVARPEHAAAQLMLEIKSDPDFAGDATYRRKILSAVVRDVRSAGLEPRTLLHSFDWTLLDECQAQAPEMPTSFLTQRPEAGDEEEDPAQAIGPDLRGQEARIPDLVAARGGALWCPCVHDITEAARARARDLGLVVVVWTVNEVADIDRMIALGVDGICTDYPGRVQRRLADHGLRWL